jgi:hypothetical protein
MPKVFRRKMQFSKSGSFDPGVIRALGITADKRALPILQQALRSQNPAIQHSAAMGLAKIGDPSSVPLIIAACETAPKDAVLEIAISLGPVNTTGMAATGTNFFEF